MNLIKTINLISVYGTSLCFLYFFFVYPFVMNGSVIKRIEKKIGAPLHFCLPMYDFQMGGYYMRGYEVAYYIVAECFGLGRYFNPLFALKQIKYDLSTAGKYEIIWSFISMAALLGFLLFLIIFALTTGHG